MAWTDQQQRKRDTNGRFLPKAIELYKERNGCIICKSHMGNTQGYPIITINGKRWRMARLFYIQAFSPIPRGLYVLHDCDNSRCVNLQHLHLGTNYDNILDRMKRGRSFKGEQNPHARLTERQVREIRKSNQTIKALARKYDVTSSAICKITLRQRWKHI